MKNNKKIIKMSNMIFYLFEQEFSHYFDKFGYEH